MFFRATKKRLMQAKVPIIFKVLLSEREREKRLSEVQIFSVDENLPTEVVPCKESSASAATPDMTKTIADAVVTNLLMQVPRVYLNASATTTHPGSALKLTAQRALVGSMINIPRGVMIFGAQVWARDKIQPHFDVSPNQAKMAGLAGSAVVGMVGATMMETWFIRRNAGIQGTIFNARLSGLYLLRETIFSGVVLGSEDFSRLSQNVMLASGAVATGLLHQRIVQMARNEPAQVVQNETAAEHLLRRSFQVKSAANIVFARFVYLGLYSQAYPISRDHIVPEIQRRFSK